MPVGTIGESRGKTKCSEETNPGRTLTQERLGKSKAPGGKHRKLASEETFRKDHHGWEAATAYWKDIAKV